MRRLTKNILLLALVMALVGAFSLQAQAYTLDFTIAAANSGVVSFAGGSNHLVGTDITIEKITSLDTPLHNGVALDITGGSLNFTTGPLVYYSSYGTLINAWVFGGTAPIGSITVTGGISAIGLSNGTTLLSGSFGTASVTEQPPVSGGSYFYVAGSNFTDTKNNALLAYFGIPSQTADGNFGINFQTSFHSAPNAFTSTTVTGGSVTNYLVPVPPTVVLLGSGLVGLVGLRYRRRKADARI